MFSGRVATWNSPAAERTLTITTACACKTKRGRLFQIQAAPAVPARHTRIRLPEPFELRELFCFRDAPLPVELLDRGAHPKIIARKNIQPAQRKDQQHLRG